MKLSILNLKTYWNALSLPFMLFTVWLWFFPMYGPLLIVSEVNSVSLFLLFLLSHALALVSYGYIVDIFYQRKIINDHNEIISMILVSLLLSFCTIIFPYLPGYLFIPMIILIGLLSGPLVVFYLYYLAVSVNTGLYGRMLALIFFLAGLIYAIFLLIPFNNWMYIVNGLFLTGPLLLPNRSLKSQKIEKTLHLKETNSKYWISLILLVFMFYVGGGLMYNLLYTEIITNSISNYNIGFLFYPLIIVPAGYFADRKGRNTIINTGICFSALGFLLLLISNSLNSISLTFLQSGFAVMDLYVFLTLMDWTNCLRNRKFIGVGLFINVIIIFISSLPFLEENITEIIPGKYWPVVGLVFVIFIIPLLNYLKETFPVIQKKYQSREKPTDYETLFNQFSLSPREKEVVYLFLEGKDTRAITDLLSISYNTLKTHLRNIFRKTETGSQSELILMIWENTNKGT